MALAPTDDDAVVRRPAIRDEAGRTVDLDRAVLTILVVGTVALAALDAASGVAAAHAVVSAALLAVNVASSALLWHCTVRRTRSLAELAGAGIAGAIVITALGSFLIPTAWPRILVFALAPSAAIALRVRDRRRRLAHPRVRLDPTSLLGASLAFAAAVFVSRWQWQRYDLAQVPGFMSIQPDTVFFEVLAQANGQFGHGLMGSLSDWPIRYHWLTYGLVGSLESATGSPAFTELTRTIPFLMIAGLALLAAGWSRRLTPARWVPTAAASSVTVGRLVADSAGATISWDSPSQTMAEVVLLGLLLAVTAPQVGARRFPGLLATMAAGAFVLAGMKVSAAVVAVLALAAVGVGAGMRGTLTRRTATVIAAGAIAAIAGWVAFAAGQAGSGGLRLAQPGGLVSALADWADRTPAALAITLAVLPGWAGIAYALRSRRRGLRTAADAAVGAAVAGLLPIWVLVEARPNTVWFLNAAVVVVWVVAVAAAAEGIRRLGLPRRRRRVLLATGALASVALALAWGLVLDASAAAHAHPQVTYVLLLLVAGPLAALSAGRARGRRLLAAAVASTVLVGSLGVVTNIVAERMFAISIGGTASSEFADAGPPAWTAPPATATAADAAALAAFLADRARPGEVIALHDDVLLPAAAMNRLRPYVSRAWYAINLGPQGTAAEVLRRRAVVAAALGGDARAEAALCHEGVRWITTRAAPDHDGVDWTRLADSLAVGRLRCTA